MPTIPTPDFDSDLSQGDKIDLQNPPQHCGSPMDVWHERDGVLVVCRDDDYQFHTDINGVLTEPPFGT